MDLNRLTEKSQEAIRHAQALATQRGNQQVDVEHLMLALLEQEGGLVPSILLRADVPLDSLHRSLTDELDKLPKVTGSGATDQGCGCGQAGPTTCDDGVACCAPQSCQDDGSGNGTTSCQ